MNLSEKINELKKKHAANLETIAAIQAENREINRTIKKLEEIEATMSGIFGEPVKEEADEAEGLL